MKATQPRAGILFEEKQYFPKMLRIAVPLVTLAAFAFVLLIAPPGRISSAAIFFFFALDAAVIALLYVSHLRTRVTREGVFLQLWPFHLREKCFTRDDFDRAAAVTYSPLRDYGGWGIRTGREGMAYNASGDKGVKLFSTWRENRPRGL